MTDDTIPEPDRAPGAPHPRHTARIFGQDAAIAGFLEAFNSGRMHHGWLLTGVQGIGKATLAWAITRFLLATPMRDTGGLFGDAPPPATSLDIAADHPVARRVAALSDPGLFLLRRAWDEQRKRLRAQITVDEVRRLRDFFALSAAGGGRRVVIVDAADELNPNAANALLKLLEEPPANVTLLLVSHQPSRLLPTIRSRCRELRLAPLAPADMAHALTQAEAPAAGDPAALAELAQGSVGEAVRLATLDGLKIYAELVSLMGTLPRLDRSRALALANAAAGRGAEDKRDLLIGLLDIFMARAARTGATGQPPRTEAAPGEAAILARLVPSPARARDMAGLAQELGERLHHGRAVNVDPASLILDALLRLQGAA